MTVPALFLLPRFLDKNLFILHRKFHLIEVMAVNLVVSLLDHGRFAFMGTGAAPAMAPFFTTML